ncbi:biofilm formation protein PslC [Desulfomarina profundi]|uniref:Biofilm formation protein PslC n=1 Tax=Desulfomarina profundi TaxID=2772557 RepID=A0A8D5FHT3_9BACT|nr:glycosyltransferase family 2 protein [Desulfomarina profundi]BCL60940.1 biofilm formation protein PslC [Desulfomarina profundi]
MDVTKAFEKNAFSILIPTLNGGDTLEKLFVSLKKQDLQPAEILVADSSSSDGTVDICRKYGARVWRVNREDFDHGGTRTFLVGKTNREIIVFLTQDIEFASSAALRLLIEPLVGNGESCVCSYGRQLPAADASWHAAFLRRFNYPERSQKRSFNDRQKLGLRTIFTSNSFAAYRRRNLLAVGSFRNGLIFGEDTCTVGKILQDGGTIAYVAEAAVYHSHNYSLQGEFRRAYDTGVLHSSEKWLLDTFGTAEGIGFSFVRSAFAQLLKEGKFITAIEFIIRTGLKFTGYRLGRKYTLLPPFLHSSFSMNRTWWQRRNTT